MMMVSSTLPLVLSCSPRKGGNSDTAADLLAQAAAEAGARCEVLRLRDFEVLACRGCNHCGRNPEHRCILADKDQAELLFARLLTAPWVAFTAPIYFYHLPSLFKALIDRAQRFYNKARTSWPPSPTRQAHLVLVAGRARGEQLFEGSLLTLKYFLRPLGLEAGEPLLMRGLDSPADLGGSERAANSVRELGRKAAGREAV